ncbi:MAG: HD domain-containing protein, partial [Burkholderiaceae bacterium]|nr:HD domain-containing protein [Burkholderiaceae bacterium]
QITDTLKTPCFHDLFKLFWADAEMVRLFKAAPAAKKMHHAYIGGLLEHTLSMAILVDRLAGHYTGVDRDLLLAGAILHDIGKIREFEFSSHIDYTSEGRLLSHIVIGLQIIDEKMKLIEDFPEEQAVLLKHLVVSHHGVKEFGSPELPKTVEAVLLNHIDEIDSKVKGIREFMASEGPNAS